MRLASPIALSIVMVALNISCSTVTFQPLVAHRVWEKKPKEEVFDAAVRVLHAQDFMIAAADKSSGVIATDWREFARGKTRLRMRVNLLVLNEQSQSDSVDLSFKSLVQRNDGTGWNDLADREDKIDSDSYARMTRALDDFFLEVQRYVGPSAQTNR